ncbi:MAG: DUF3955 domain-containing protein [Anaerolineae bacterium]
MNMAIRISSSLGILLLGAAISCVVAFNMIGSEVDAQGVLHEPFFLIPLFWLFFMSSLAAWGLAIAARLARKNMSKK